MHRSFDLLIRPILEEIKFNHIVEIGCKKGLNTLKILELCKIKNAILSIVDPYPQLNKNQLESRYYGMYHIYEDLSLNVINKLHCFDVILINGDHNYYTVNNELKKIEEKQANQFPIVFFHDVSWPYARRDLYYNPDSIPNDFLFSFEKKGFHPEKPGLIDGGLNSHLKNAKEENTQKNGVLTAIEDFIKDSELDLYFNKVNFMNGIGLLTLAQNNEIIKKFERLINSKVLTEILEYEKCVLESNNSILNYAYKKDTESLNKKNCEKAEENSELIKEIERKAIEHNKLNEKIEEKAKENNALDKILKQKDKVNHDLLMQINILKNDKYNIDCLMTSLNEDIRKGSYKKALYSLYQYTRFNSGLASLKEILKDDDFIPPPKLKNYAFYFETLSKVGLKKIINHKRHMDLLKNSKLFDMDYYLINNPDIYISGINPYFHYLYYGGFEEKAASKKFDSKYYLTEYKDAKDSNLNPLVHYELYGRKKGRATRPIAKPTLNKDLIKDEAIIKADNSIYAWNYKNTNNQNINRR